MKKRNFCFLVLFFYTTIIVSGNHSRTLAQEIQDDLLEKVKTSFYLASKSLESLFVQYEIKTEILIPDQSSSHVALIPIDTNPVVTFAFYRNKRFTVTIQGGEKDKTRPGFIVRYEKGTKKPITLPESFASSFDGKQILKRYGGTFETIPLNMCKDTDPVLFKQDYLEGVMFVQPNVISDDTKSSRFRLPDALEVASLPKNSASDGTVDDALCRVIEFQTPRRRVFVDPTLNYAVRRIDYLGASDNEISLRITNNNFTKIHNSLYLPRKVVRESNLRKISNTPEKYSVAVRTIYDVKKLSVNDVSDSLFALSAEPGNLVADYTHTQQDGDQTEGLSYWNPTDPKDINAIIDNFYSSPNAGPRPRVVWFKIVLVIVGLGLIIMSLYMKIKRRKMNQKEDNETSNTAVDNISTEL